MSFKPEISGAVASGKKTSINLLNIDFDAHLHKVASNTYRSPSHFPVELVRSALKRNAARVEILIKRDRVEIRDNGSGIHSQKLKALCNIYDSNQSIEEKEQAVADFQTKQGIGLLALFAPSPERIQIENVSYYGKSCFLFNQGKVQKSDPCRIKSGTQITLFRKGNTVKQEKTILQEYCRGVQKEIILNECPIGKKSMLPGAIVSSKLKASEGFGEGIIGIPRNGNICRIWLLDQGIPWFHTTLSPWKGFIFEAAVEYTGKVNAHLLNWISGTASKLYEGLTLQYSNCSSQDRARVEELVFKHNRITGDSHFVSQFSPFKVINPPLRFSFAQICQKAASETLYAIPKKDSPRRYNTHGKTVLLLSKNQADFLINHARMPIRFLSPMIREANSFQRIYFSLLKKGRKFISRIHIGSQNLIDKHTLTSDESVFLKALTLYLSMNSLSYSYLSSDKNIEPAMTNSRGFFPAIIIKKDKALRLIIRRKHSFIQKAIRAAKINPENIELAESLLIQEDL